MISIKDKNGRNIDISLTISGVRKVKSRCNVDLLKPEDGEENNLVFRLCTDDLLLADVIATLAETRERTSDDIVDTLDGACLKDALSALLGELTDFFQARNCEFRAVLIETQVSAVKMAYQAEIKTLQEMEKSLTASTTPQG